MHDEAEVLEHAVSDRLLEAIAAQLGHPVRDPHGDPIPAIDGSIARPAAVLLRDAPEDAVGSVVRISDRNPALLRQLAAESLALGSEVTILRRTAGGGVAVDVGGRERELDDEAAASIWVSLIR